MSAAQPKTEPSDLYITEELAQRLVPQADFLKEKRAIEDIAARMLDAPQEVLPRFVELAIELTGGISAGLSLYEETPPPGVFRWRYLKGRLSQFEDALTPRDYSPCGVTMDAGAPVLSRHPERYYDWIAEAGIAVPEVLLVPLHFYGSAPIGTLWVVSAQEGHFHSGHARAARELAHFAGIAVRMRQTQEQLQRAVERGEVLAREMNHRIKNLFTIAQGLVSLTARAATGKDDMAETLAGRFAALARAHTLVQRDLGAEAQEDCNDLGALLKTIIAAHDHGEGRHITLTGPAVRFGAQAVNGLALVFHELTTNAAKYGALATQAGRIAIAWEVEEDRLDIFWTETGGREIVEVPELNGFGSKLLRDAIIRQFGGTLKKEWFREGLKARITLPLKALSG